MNKISKECLRQLCNADAQKCFQQSLLYRGKIWKIETINFEKENTLNEIIQTKSLNKVFIRYDSKREISEITNLENLQAKYFFDRVYQHSKHRIILWIQLILSNLSSVIFDKKLRNCPLKVLKKSKALLSLCRQIFKPIYS